MVTRVSARLGILRQAAQALRGEPIHHGLLDVLIRLADHVGHHRPALGRPHQEPHGGYRFFSAPFVGGLTIICNKMEIASADEEMALFGLMGTHRRLPGFGTEDSAPYESNRVAPESSFYPQNLETAQILLQRADSAISFSNRLSRVSGLFAVVILQITNLR